MSSHRDSLASQASEFSFEQGKKELNSSAFPAFPAAAAAAAADNDVDVDDTVQVPSSMDNTNEEIIKENEELKKVNAQQASLITVLQKEIADLERQLRDKHSIVKNEIIQPPPPTTDKALDLVLPPRSANRLRLKMDSPSLEKFPTPPEELAEPITNGAEHDTNDKDFKLGNDTMETIKQESSEGLRLYQKENTEYNNNKVQEDDGDQLSSETSNRHINPTNDNTEKTADNKFSTPPLPNGELTTPLSSNSNIDWNAAMQALSSSPLEIRIDTPKSIRNNDKSHGTPYSGRIQIKSNNGTPSPIKKDSLSPIKSYSDLSHNDLSPALFGSSARSMMSTSKMSLNLNQELSTPRSVSDSPHSSSLQPPLSKYKHNVTSVDMLNQNRYQDQIDFSDAPSPVIHQVPQQATNKQHVRYPSDVPLFVEPQQLSTVKPEIITTINGNPTKKSDDPTIVIAAFDRQTNKEMWRFKKTLSQVLLLDSETRPLINSFSLPPVPEKSLFLTNVPMKVDLRRSRLKDYFLALFAIPNIPIEAAYKISRFMSLDVVNLLDESNTEVFKEGWLLRRTTKGLTTTWKARYCQIENAVMNISENANSLSVEQIKLTSAQIGRQPDNLKPTDDKSAYRHAFAIMEPKKGKTTTFTKHIFCAETDQERDLWINTLIQFISGPSTPQSQSSEPGNVSNIASQTTLAPSIHSEYSESLHSPRGSPTKTHVRSGSRGTNNETDDDDVSTLNPMKDSKKYKKRSFFPFGKRDESDTDNSLSVTFTASNKRASFLGAPNSSTNGESNIEKQLQDMNLTQSIVTNPRAVFANELPEVLSLSSNELYGQRVPSVVYRCLKYLIEAHAVEEEGIFRLSGSAALIKQLREQFDKEHDVDFKTLPQRPDINTIAGLFKLWLRELPTNILTKDYLPKFKENFNQIKDSKELLLSYRELTKELPIINQSVLYVLFKFLNDVVKNKEYNKMNLRNLCIVFSPTLNIPAEVLIPFLVDFQCIFENGDPIDSEDREVMDLNIPSF